MTAKKNGNDGRTRLKVKRVVFRVQWSKADRAWKVKGDEYRILYMRKRDAVAEGVLRASWMHKNGIRTQLVIHTKDGRIESERTYGADPVRRKG